MVIGLDSHISRMREAVAHESTPQEYMDALQDPKVKEYMKGTKLDKKKFPWLYRIVVRGVKDETFDMIDADKDGFITRTEFMDAVECRS